MTSKRALRRRACDSKRTFVTEGEAWTALRALIRNKPDSGFMTAYRCPVSHQHFHIGHAPANVRQSFRDKARARRG